MYFGSSGPGKNWPSELGDWKVYKKYVTKQFKKGEIRLLISTIAFGMGIDIPNIRYVVHYGISSSLGGIRKQEEREETGFQPM